MMNTDRIETIKELHKQIANGTSPFTSQASAMDLATHVPWLLLQLGEGSASAEAVLRDGIAQIKQASTQTLVRGMCDQILKDASNGRAN